MSPRLPERTRVYQNHHMDSTIWDEVVPRDDDIIIATAYKAGTTWTQQIVAMLLFQGHDPPQPVAELSPWIDLRVPPREEKLPALEAQTTRRFLKTHLPLDGLRFFPQCKYIYMGRDGRDVFMSLWNHYHKANDTFYELINDSPGRVGPPLARCPDDIHEVWKGWVEKASFPWENEGWPFWSMFHHLATWWAYRDLPNLLFVHFNQLKDDLPGQLRRIAAFLDIELDEDRFPTIVDKCGFTYMKQNADHLIPLAGEIFQGGAKSFINKGTNGRWRDVLSADELAAYDALVAARLPPDAARWLATGECPDGGDA
ncbi:sulfotransferase domain-containing protein [Haliangium sp.]|uniref:sulfotransferase domain-containing protein n=1 Tax=Haliangium sp. TaxID=2663208 RepID=UPI003D0C9433